MNQQAIKDHGFSCPKCASAEIRRSRRQGSFELLGMLIGVYPFRCLKCNERFSGNVWILANRGNATCPRCLRLDVQPAMKRDSHMTARDRFKLSLGAHMYRCVPCRLTFFSFRKSIYSRSHQRHVEPVGMGARTAPNVSDVDG
jgi:DNA-directed RNA polymerase subunit RPC12/RpoP